MSSTKKVHLENLGYVQNGYSIRKKINVTPDLATHWLIPMRAIKGDYIYSINWNDLEPIQLEEKYSDYVLKNGDVLFSIRGNFRAIYIENVPENILIHNNWAFLTTNKNADGAYVASWFNHKKTQYHLSTIAMGSALPFLSLKDLGKLEIPLPSLEKQKKIIKLQALVQREKELIEKLKTKRLQLIDSAINKLILED